MPWSNDSLTALRPAPESQQKDNLCGPYHAARLLLEAGVSERDGLPIDQDLVAVRAGTALPEPELGPQVPPGAVPSRDYRYELPRVDPARSGTSAAGLVSAIEELSEGELACVPFSGHWTPGAVEGLLAGAARPGVRLLANLRTGLLWGSRPPVDALVAALQGIELADPPAADWDTGHFVELVQLVRGRAGALVLVRDSYPSLGWGGHHLQPPGALAAALLRGDGREGGVLAVARADAAAELEQLAPGLGLALHIWDN